MDFSSVGDNTDKNVCISKTDKGCNFKIINIIH